MRKEIEVIKKHRKKIGLTQAELADKAGIGRSTLPLCIEGVYCECI